MSFIDVMKINDVMKKFLLVICLSVVAVLSSSGQKVSDETLTYNVMFKWGFIEKEAGVIRLSTEVNKDEGYFTSVMTGASTSIADKIYSVRDTLSGKMMLESLEPVYYEKIAHEGGEFSRDVIHYTRDSAGSVSAKTLREKTDKKGNSSKGEKLLTATGITLDMLSAFYYMRHIDYQSMSVGESVVFNIFSARHKELLRITYLGTEDVKTGKNGELVPTYHISFTFTYDDKNKEQSSDPIEAWMSQNEERTPLQIVGKLPVGKIRCRLVSE